MMKTVQWPFLVLAAFTVLSFQGCEQWGQMDPPAADQKTPRLEQVAKITFEEEEFNPESFDFFAYEGGNLAAIADDEAQGKVLHLPDGYARTNNPLTGASVQNGVSLTFFARQAVLTDEESGETLENDLAGALFSFQNANGTQRMYFTANGTLVYDGVDGSYTTDASVKTGMMSPPGEWHYVALTVRDDGYTVFVNGRKRIDETVPKSRFDFGKIVRFMAGTPHLYIGYGADAPTKEMWIDDVTLYANRITSKEQADPRVQGPGEEAYERYFTIGKEDNTTGWWEARSEVISMTGSGNRLNIDFQNYTNSLENWLNWMVVLTNGKAFGEEGYVEYFLLRADAFGWGDGNYNAANITTEGYPANDSEWATYRDEMNDAAVNLSIERQGNTILVKATQTGRTGKVYVENFTYTNSALPAEIGAFLTVEGGHLVVDRKSIYISGIYAPGAVMVGNTDNSSPYYGAVSELWRMSGDNVTHLKFINYTSGISNWNNWNIVASHSQATGAMGGEYLVLRADLWENVGTGSNVPVQP